MSNKTESGTEAKQQLLLYLACIQTCDSMNAKQALYHCASQPLRSNQRKVVNRKTHAEPSHSEEINRK